jgi:hypothetical protein
MMIRASAAGLAPHLVLHYTPRELYAFMRGTERRFREEAKLALFGAWQTANLGRANPKKHLPKLADLMRKLDENPDMTPQQLRAALLGWHKEAGGATRVVPKGTIKRPGF